MYKDCSWAPVWISALQVASSREGLEGGLKIPEKLLQQVSWGQTDRVSVSVDVQAKHQYNTNNFNRGLAEASSALETIIEMGDHYQTGLTRKLKQFLQKFSAVLSDQLRSWNII